MSPVADNTHVGWAQMPGQPRVCDECGKKIVLSRGAWFKTFPPLKSWHHGCYPQVKWMRGIEKDDDVT